jgi:cbb3-type cytochrome oxidase cytochrome c subunit
MNRGPLIFLAAFFALASSWFVFVLAPQIQLGRQVETKTVPAGDLYPVARPGLARQGREVYRANGCATCHSQQVRQNGVSVGTAVVKAGTNLTELVEAILKVAPEISRNKAARMVQELPQPILTGVTRAVADKARRQIEVTGAKAAVTVQPVGPDIARGWGKRRSVAVDFLHDQPVMLGSQRVGPDLANIGGRAASEEWLLWHLYNPRSVTLGSTMPPFRYLFEKRRVQLEPSPDALRLPEGFKPEAVFEIVPKPEAKALVAYLMSLKTSAQLFETPMLLPPESAVAATNTAAASSGSASNAPVKP